MTKRKFVDTTNNIAEDYEKIASLIFSYENHMGTRFNIYSSSKYILDGIEGLIDYLKNYSSRINCQIITFSDDEDDTAEITYCGYNNRMFKITLLYKIEGAQTHVCYDGDGKELRYNVGDSENDHYHNIRYKWTVVLM